MKTCLLQWNPGRGWGCAQTLLASPGLVLYFGTTDALSDGSAFESLSALFPDALIAGCSAGSQISQSDVGDDGMHAVAIEFDHVRVRGSALAISGPHASRVTGEALARALVEPDLAAVLVFSDGLQVNGTALVEGLVAVLGDSVPVSGGLAGDGARFERTLVGLNARPSSGQVVAIGLYGESLRIGHSAVGGWDSFGPPRKITGSQDNVLLELDGKPALDLYERYLGDEAQGLPGTALLFPLQIWDPRSPQRVVVRTVLSVDKERRSMTFAGDIPQGWSAQLMRGRHEHLIDGAASAAAQVSAAMADAGPGARLALLISCVGRRLLMGARTAEETEAVASALAPNTVRIGFYSYGEIAPRALLGKCDLHNQTMTVTMIAEAN